MSKLAHTTSPILSPDSNPLLRFFLKNTFYTQFCAGENAKEVERTVNQLRKVGLDGVILAYAKEVVLDEKQTSALASCGNSEAAESCIRNEIKPWAKGTLDTVNMTSPGEFVALKFTGAGSQALYDLSQGTSPTAALRASIDEICDLAAKRGVRLLFDAEQQALQPGIDAWTLEYMRRYNTSTAVIYGTYQAYLKGTPKVLASHLAAAKEGKFTLGVKLVRGAYLGSDPRELIHDTKADTDNCYNGIAESLARRTYNNILKPAGTGLASYPNVCVVLAGHNITSVRLMRALREKQAQAGEKRIDLVYAQLQGMADEVSCELVQGALVAENSRVMEKVDVDVPKTYKYLVWGTTGECMKYLLRRANENKDAVERTREGRDAMAGELWRRLRGVFGA
jgi:proline dehydrogenase